MKSLAPTSRFVALAALLGSAWLQPVAAAPFCLQSQVIQPQCIYYDATQCQREAQRQGAGATCGANQQEVKLRPNAGPYCVVTSSQVPSCIYVDRQTCSSAASQLHGICADAPAAGAARVREPDPYSSVDGN